MIAVGVQGVGVAVDNGVLVLVGVGLEPLPGGMTRRSISLGCRFTVKFEPVLWATPAMEARLEGEGLELPLTWRPGASWGAPVVEVPEGNIAQACPVDAGVKPVTEMFAAWLLVGWLLTTKRVRLPEASLAA